MPYRHVVSDLKAWRTWPSDPFGGPRTMSLEVVLLREWADSNLSSA